MRSRWLTLAGAVVVMPLIFYPLRWLTWRVSDLLGDGGYYRFDREHHLPHGYSGRMTKSLIYLQEATLVYCQTHQGKFPPMRDALQTQRALSPIATRSALFLNPATKHLFQPNAALQGHRYREMVSPAEVLLFYDPQPPSTYPKVYYVMLSGHTGRVDLKDWPELKRSFR